MRFKIDIKRKDGLADPEGMATRRALLDLGYETVEDVHFGRTIFLDVTEDDRDAAAAMVSEMCARLLANPVMEDYALEVVE
jgi:phosphoribosylformylglycinamidine synthase